MMISKRNESEFPSPFRPLNIRRFPRPSCYGWAANLGLEVNGFFFAALFALEHYRRTCTYCFQRNVIVYRHILGWDGSLEILSLFVFVSLGLYLVM